MKVKKQLKVETWKTAKLIRYQHDKQLYPKIYQKKGKQWRDLHFWYKGFLFAWTYYVLYKYHFTHYILPYFNFDVICYFYCFSFVLCYFWDSIDWKTSLAMFMCIKIRTVNWHLGVLFAPCSWLRYSFHGFFT